MNREENLEFLRKKALKEYKMAHKTAVTCSLILFVYLFGVNIENFFNDTFIDSIGRLIGCICASMFIGMLVKVALRNALAFDSIKKFKDAYKQTIVLSVLKDIFNGSVVDFSKKSYDEMANISERFVGRYKGVSFSFKEGVFEFEFNKPFQHILQISERGFRSSIWSTDLAQLKTLRKIKIEDVEFNNKFNIYAQNEEEAFYMLTPNFIQRIKKLSTMKNVWLNFKFEDKYLRITVCNFKNWFEGNLFKPIINENTAKESVMQDIKFITDFVDELLLYNDLFKKERSENNIIDRVFYQIDKERKDKQKENIIQRRIIIYGMLIYGIMELIRRIFLSNINGL